MKATVRLPRRANYADYLAVEQHGRHRHELIDGVIVAMAGGSTRKGDRFYARALRNARSVGASPLE